VEAKNNQKHSYSPLVSRMPALFLSARFLQQRKKRPPFVIFNTEEAFFREHEFVFSAGLFYFLDTRVSDGELLFCVCVREF